jgi:ankyrin repeat protein
MAVRNSDAKWTRLLIENACDFDIRGEDGSMALFEALGQALFDNAQLFLSRGVSFTAVSQDRQTPLHFAVKYGHGHSQPRANFMRSLIHQGVNLNTQDRKGRTALHIAVSIDDEEAVQLLCEEGINVMLKDAVGETAGEKLKSYEKPSKRGDL